MDVLFASYKELSKTLEDIISQNDCQCILIDEWHSMADLNKATLETAFLVSFIFYLFIVSTKCQYTASFRDTAGS